MQNLALLLLLLTSPVAVYSADGAVAGKIGSVNNSTGEIVVNTGNSKYQVDMGDKLYVRVDGNAVIMKAVFPMLTVVKCRIESKYKINLKKISEGMTVYKYKSGVEINADNTSENGINSVNRRRSAGAGKSLPLEYHNTIWKIISHGSDPALYYVIFKPDGEIGYNYDNIETFKVNGADRWHVEGDTLVVSMESIYSIEKFKISPRRGVFKGKRISRNDADEKDCTIERIGVINLN